jgi:Tol biopolymer transport system component
MAGQARDLRKVAYVRDGNIKLMNVAGRRTRLLTSDASSDGYAPDWSPDGRRIIHTGPGGLYVLDVKTGQVRNLAVGWTAPATRKPRRVGCSVRLRRPAAPHDVTQRRHGRRHRTAGRTA